MQDLMKILLLEAQMVTDEADLRLDLRNPAVLFNTAMRVTQRMLQNKPKPRLDEAWVKVYRSLKFGLLDPGMPHLQV